MKVQLKKIADTTAELVDIITADDKPLERDVYTYYGPKAKPSDFKPQKNTRLVFKDPDGRYYVIPDTAGNRWLWSKCD